MLRTNVRVAHILGFLSRQFQGLIGTLIEGYDLSVRLTAMTAYLFNVLTQIFQIHPQRLKCCSRDTLALNDEAKQEMLRPCAAMV